jgi:hypothetical protein
VESWPFCDHRNTIIKHKASLQFLYILSVYRGGGKALSAPARFIIYQRTSRITIHNNARDDDSDDDDDDAVYHRRREYIVSKSEDYQRRD